MIEHKLIIKDHGCHAHCSHIFCCRQSFQDKDTKPVSEESDKRGSNENCEGQNCVDQGDVDVADADVLEDIVIA